VKVYVVNVNNCRAYSDYYEGNVGVYRTRQAALDSMRAKGFDLKSRRRKVPWDGCGPDWEEWEYFDVEEFRIEEWEVDA